MLSIFKKEHLWYTLKGEELMPDETDGLNRQQHDEHKDKEQELLKQAWYEKAEKCPVRCGPRCNLSGEFCIMKNCFGEYWKKYDK